VAKQTILICDWCEDRKDAVATLALTNGLVTRGAPTLDLCKKHVRHLTKMFVPKKRHRTKPVTKPKRRTRTKHDYPKLEAKALKLVERFPHLVAVDIAKHLKIGVHTAQQIAKNLITAGKLKAHSSGAGRYLTKP
jgi:hypothetical protein